MTAVPVGDDADGHLRASALDEAARASLDEALATAAEVLAFAEQSVERSTLRDRVMAVVLGGGFVVTALGLAVAGLLHRPGPTATEAVLGIGLLCCYVVALRTSFESATGAAVPTQPVLVAMLFLLPTPLVPGFVLLGLLLASSGEERSANRFLTLCVQAVAGWHCVGPVLVLWGAGATDPSLDAWPLYALALAAQFAGDALTATLRCWSLGVPPGRLVVPLAWTFSLDALLAPLALCVVIATGSGVATLAFAALPVALIALLARDREDKHEQVVSLGQAYTSVQAEARHDALTGLANRRAWDEAVREAEAGQAGRTHVLTVVAADLDGLKRVNDGFGHEAGDELISGFAQVLQRAYPEALAVARLGGDEFAALLRSDHADDEADLLDRLREGLRRHPGVLGVPLSASVGAASCPPCADLAVAARLADDRAMADKVARRAGRDHAPGG